MRKTKVPLTDNSSLSDPSATTIINVSGTGWTKRVKTANAVN